jgi:hypothetical protein
VIGPVAATALASGTGRPLCPRRSTRLVLVIAPVSVIGRALVIDQEVAIDPGLAIGRESVMAAGGRIGPTASTT